MNGALEAAAGQAPGADPRPAVALLHCGGGARQLRQELRAEIWLLPVPQRLGRSGGERRPPPGTPGPPTPPVHSRACARCAVPRLGDSLCSPHSTPRIRRRTWWPRSKSWWTRAPSRRASPRSATLWTPVRLASEAGGCGGRCVRISAGRTGERDGGKSARFLSFGNPLTHWLLTGLAEDSGLCSRRGEGP